jgi:hypothetical protein
VTLTVIPKALMLRHAKELSGTGETGSENQAVDWLKTRGANRPAHEKST